VATVTDDGAGAEPGVQQRAAEEDDLVASLHGLSVLQAGRLPLEELLTRVARYAVQAIPGADGAGLTLIQHRRADTIVKTADFVEEVDGVQYGIGEGPCITAARDGVTVVSGSLGADVRWPRFGGRVARLGVHSALSLPLITSDGVVGAMNVYARAKHVFDDRAAELGELFAVPAAVAVQNARVLEETRRLADGGRTCRGHRHEPVRGGRRRGPRAADPAEPARARQARRDRPEPGGGSGPSGPRQARRPLGGRAHDRGCVADGAHG
jgi:GAF domain-containing protein